MPEPTSPIAGKDPTRAIVLLAVSAFVSAANIRISDPSTSHVYHVGFKNFSNPNFPNTVTYNVYCGGVLVNAGNNQFPAPPTGQWIYVGDVQYASSGPCTYTPVGATVNAP